VLFLCLQAGKTSCFAALSDPRLSTASRATEMFYNTVA
jgi:hypothetical protein